MDSGLSIKGRFAVRLCPHLYMAFSVVLLLCAACEKKDTNPKVPVNQVAVSTTTLATIVNEVPSQAVLPSLSMGLHTPQAPSFDPLFSKYGDGVAYSAYNNDKAYVVHNGRSGKLYDAVGTIALSSDGRRIAYGALAAGKWRMIIDGTEGAPFSTVKSPLFSPDGRHLAYQAMSGEKWFLVVDRILNPGTTTRFLDHQFSGDSGKIAYIDNADDYNRKGRLVVSDLAFTRQTIINTGALMIKVSQNGSRIAAIILSDNRQHIVECSFDRPDVIKNGPQYATIHNTAFAPDSVSLAYSAERDGRHFMVFKDREEALPVGGRVIGAPVVRPDLRGVGSIISVNNQVFFHQSFLDEGKKENGYDEASGLTYNSDSSLHAYAARRGASWFIVVNGIEGTGFDRVISPRFSPDGKYLVYRARKDGRRFVVVADRVGKTLRQHKDYEQVFDVEFTADGKSVAYGVKDGQKLVWSVEPL